MELKESNYFLISVSNRKNLNLCIKYAIAGFTNSINGLWTYSEIDVGDYVSFLYGARVKNLYKVVKKGAYRNAEKLPPWQPITFRKTDNTYFFPFRLFLKQERNLDEPMVRPEFSYVAENLLLRGGYKKTHFQADTVTFYNVSEMGQKFRDENDILHIDGETFEPKIVFSRNKQKIPEKFYFRELILQSLIRKKIKHLILSDILNFFDVKISVDEFEVLGEKALSEGFVDLFIKMKHPKGGNKFLLVEVKTGRAQEKDFKQLIKYINEFGNEVIGGVLIAKDFPKKAVSTYRDKILPVNYSFDALDNNSEYAFSELLQLLKLEVGL